MTNLDDLLDTDIAPARPRRDVGRLARRWAVFFAAFTIWRVSKIPGAIEWLPGALLWTSVAIVLAHRFRGRYQELFDLLFGYAFLALIVSSIFFGMHWYMDLK